MPLDSEDKFDYETIYTVKKKSDASGEYSPLGSGKKSQFAIGRTARQEESWAFFLAELSAGSSMPARIAMIAITTRSSISVKRCVLRFR